MSALAAMFNPPRVRPTATRVIVAGKEVRTKADIPPMPDATDREAVKRALSRNKARKWTAENPEKRREYIRKWNAENADKKRAQSSASYHRRKSDPGFAEKKRIAAAAYRARHPNKTKESAEKWREKNGTEYWRAWRAENGEKVRKYSRDYEERKRNEREQEKREHEQRAQAEAAQAIERGRKSSSTAHTKRVQTFANDARSISAASV